MRELLPEQDETVRHSSDSFISMQNHKDFLILNHMITGFFYCLGVHQLMCDLIDVQTFTR